MADPHVLVRPAVGFPVRRFHRADAGHRPDRRVAAAPAGEYLVRLPGDERVAGLTGPPSVVRLMVATLSRREEGQTRGLTPGLTPSYRFQITIPASGCPRIGIEIGKTAQGAAMCCRYSRLLSLQRRRSIAVLVLPRLNLSSCCFSVGTSRRNPRCWSPTTPFCLRFLRPTITSQVRSATC